MKQIIVSVFFDILTSTPGNIMPIIFQNCEQKLNKIGRLIT